MLSLLACTPDPDTSSLRRARAPQAVETADTGALSDTTTTDSTTDSTDTTTTTDGGPLWGVDVSGWDPGVDWDAVDAEGITFAIVKATEGTYYTNDEFRPQYDGAASVGMIRGAYHFANPSYSDATSQADFFVENGGGWQADGRTLPGTLDVEWNPYDGDDCYDMDKGELVAWIREFVDEYRALTGRAPMIYTSGTYWGYCVDVPGFAEEVPLWVADFGVDTPELPNGWDAYTFWQYDYEGRVDGIDGDVDRNRFEGGPQALERFADGDQ